MEHLTDLWEKTLLTVKERVSKPSYETWLKATEPLELKEDTLLIAAPNEFAKDWLEDRYSVIIASTVEEITGSKYDVKFVIPQERVYDTTPENQAIPSEKDTKKRNDATTAPDRST